MIFDPEHDYEEPDRKVSLETRRKQVLTLLMDGGWHSTAELIKAGGTSGDRRMREIRAAGERTKRWHVEKRKREDSDQSEYRLVLGAGEEPPKVTDMVDPMDRLPKWARERITELEEFCKRLRVTLRSDRLQGDAVVPLKGALGNLGF